MSKINHDRPYLKYINNIQREIKRSSAFSSKKPEIGSSVTKGITIGKRLWNKISRINLTKSELEKISKLLYFLNEYYFMQYKFIELLMDINQGIQKKALMNEMEQLKQSMVSIAVQIIVLELIARNNGREKGIFDWLNLLGEHMSQNGFEDGWYFLSKTVFKEASDALSYFLETPDIALKLNQESSQ